MLVIGSSKVWLLFGLLVIPLAVLGVDVAQRNVESHPFPTAPIHAGERFVYDVTVVSDFERVAVTARRHISVEFGESDADADPSIVVRTDRGAAPWDPHVSSPPDGGQALIAARMKTIVEETIDGVDGRILHRTDRRGQEVWYGRDGTILLDRASGRTDGVPWREQGVAFPLAEQADIIWRPHAPLLGIQAASTPDPHGLSLFGTYRGRSVFGTEKADVQRFADGGAEFGCELALPPVVYHERDTTRRYAESPLVVSTERVVWRDPDLALPVSVECHRTFRAEDGTQSGRIRVLATLVEHDPGTLAYSIPWGNLTASMPVGPMTAQRTVAPGVPADAPDTSDNAQRGTRTEEPHFVFPLSAADSVARTFVERHAPHFATPRDRPYALVAARYWPDAEPTRSQCTQVMELMPVDCDEFEGNLSPGPRIFVEPVWHVSYENSEGHELVMQVVRNMTSTGHVVEEVVTFIASRGPAVTARLAYVPERLVPVHIALAAWLEQEALAIEDWRAAHGAHFSYEMRRDFVGGDRHGILPVYSFRYGEIVHPGGPPSGAPVHPSAPRQATTEAWFGATDGALVRRSVGERVVKDFDAPSATVAAVDVVLPELETYRPAAATVAVVIGLGAVALSGTAYGTGWLRGLVLAPLMARRRKGGILDHPTRDGIVSHVMANPGVGTEEIRRHLRIGWGTAVYHLSALEEQGLLVSVRQSGNRHWFGAGHGSAEEREAIALLRSASARRVHNAIRLSPGRTQKEIAAELGISHAAVNFHVGRLARVGLVREVRDGRYVRYVATAPSV